MVVVGGLIEGMTLGKEAISQSIGVDFYCPEAFA